MSGIPVIDAPHEGDLYHTDALNHFPEWGKMLTLTYSRKIVTLERKEIR